jgi:alpha-1,3-mannosyltransferase
MFPQIVKTIHQVISTTNTALSPNNIILLISALVCIETVFCSFIIHKVSYTEIDWIAYMQEVTYFINGERNYKLIRGDTGPLVYPAGFVYIYSLLRYLTENGSNIRMAQYIFTGVYIMNLIVLLFLYLQSDAFIPLWTLGILMLSKRIHSIYILRMFNDCIAVLLGYAAIYCFTKQNWRVGSFIYSISVSIKMNMLLYAPGILFLYLVGTGIQETVLCLSICAFVQIILGYPFLSTFPIEYLQRSFDIGRVFMFEWTVNYKFLPEDIFTGKWLSVSLLLVTIIGMILFYRKLINEVSRLID